jgi:asparagine synthetase A
MNLKDVFRGVYDVYEDRKIYEHMDALTTAEEKEQEAIAIINDNWVEWTNILTLDNLNEETKELFLDRAYEILEKRNAYHE